MQSWHFSIICYVPKDIMKTKSKKTELHNYVIKSVNCSVDFYNMSCKYLHVFSQLFCVNANKKHSQGYKIPPRFNGILLNLSKLTDLTLR